MIAIYRKMETLNKGQVTIEGKKQPKTQKEKRM